jgi:hypothetical protein
VQRYADSCEWAHWRLFFLPTHYYWVHLNDGVLIVCDCHLLIDGQLVNLRFVPLHWGKGLSCKHSGWHEFTAVEMKLKTKSSLGLIKHHTMKTYVGSKVPYYTFLTAPDEVEWSPLRPSRFTPAERAPDFHCRGDWVGPRDGMDAVNEVKSLDFTPILRPSCLCPCRCTDWAVYQRNLILSQNYFYFTGSWFKCSPGFLIRYRAFIPRMSQVLKLWEALSCCIVLGQLITLAVKWY